jgi:large subunit ribosomal protein L9
MAKTAEKKKTKPKKAKTSAAAPKTTSKLVAGTAFKEVRRPGVERRKNHAVRAKDGYFQILLTHPVTSLGQTGDLVKVRPGYARNYLIPSGLGTFATPHNLRIVEKHRRRLRELDEARRADLVNLAAQISQVTISIEANAKADGALYGSVNADQIAAALRAAKFPIETENVRIEGPLKELGQYTIKVHLGFDIDSAVTLWVVPTHTEESES